MALMGSSVFAAAVPGTEDHDVTASTTQTDAYAATLDWGSMAFTYAFGTWNTSSHTWGGAGWVTAGFDGTEDKLNVLNDSSMPIDATFAFATDPVAGGTTDATFTKVSGNLSGTQTGTMALDLYPVGGAGSAYTADTYLNLTGIPLEHISTAKVGEITVTLAQSANGATTELAKVTDAAVTTVPNGTTNDQTNIEAAMLVLANAAVTTGYTVTIAAAPVSTYDIPTNAWTGKFVVTNDNTTTNTKTDANARAITVVITP